jgi:hypothetical protein
MRRKISDMHFGFKNSLKRDTILYATRTKMLWPIKEYIYMLYRLPKSI